ncbi:hypothetical protein [Aporhodopirellula aestuarii]|uniref:Uncharacterized protein n=1 Tax=Aporhodopirellula aestuarii TaxID=2950107 RepID=A0ABT0U470_9BACT|nr:hypothetical protein [Aporhodopirellula aestuarii]MCM2371673.1 hypothetical protein [Aporhodopirellula aestuarii]
MTQDDFDASAPDDTADPAPADATASSEVSVTPATTHPRFDASEVYEDVPDDDDAAVAVAEEGNSLDEQPATMANDGSDEDDGYEEYVDDEAVAEHDEVSVDVTEPAEMTDVAEESADPSSGFKPAGSDEELVELQQPFVGQWNSLVSTTNWEKGRIISEWREALIEAGAPVTDYSDEAWASRVGGVTSPHVGRLRRVYDRFGTQAKTYPSLYWSHFLAALDWDDAALWLQGAVEEKWSVSVMREQRWRANGAVESDRPGGSQIVEVDLDEDTPDLGTAPAQGGSSTRDYDGDTDGVAAGPAYEPPDFGEETELAALPEGNNMNDANQADGGGGVGVADGEQAPSPSQPFAGLPELPDDLADVIESLKLSILRHKTAGFEDVDPDVIRRYLDAVKLLIES